MVRTIGEAIAVHALARPGAPAIAAMDAPALSYGALQAAIEDVGRALAGAGIGAGDRVALSIGDRPVACAAYLSVVANATAVPLSPALTRHEAEALLSNLDISAVIISEDAEAVEAAARALGLPVHYAVPVAGQAGAFRLGMGAATGREVARAVGPDDVACVQSSSGTSGRPKAARLTHRCMLARAAADREGLRLAPDDVTVNFRPPHLAGPLNVGLLSSICAGGAVIVPPDFDPEMVFDALRTRGVTWYTGGPIYHEALLDYAAGQSLTVAASRLRFVRSAGYALPVELERRIEAEFGVPCIQKYGSSEAGLIACNPLPPGRRKPGTCGPIADCEVRLLNEDGSLAAPGEAGEIAVRGKGVFAGYDSAEMTEASFADGFFRTGDVGEFDEDGYLRVSGRKSDIINRGGQKVSPEEIEAILRSHPAVADALCFPVPHATLGETVGVAVRVEEGAEVGEAELLELTRERLARFKVPERIVRAEEFPRGPAGKPLRRAAAGFFGLTGAAPAARGEPPTDRLGELWCEVLNLARVDEDDHFSMLGGDSLRATRLLLRIEREFGRKIGQDRFYAEGATLRELRGCLERAEPSDSRSHEVMPRADRTGPVPLTSGQTRLFAIDQAFPDMAIYNMGTAVRFASKPPVEVLQRAVDAVVARHEALRARIRSVDGRLEQVFEPDLQVAVEVEDLRDLPRAAQEAEYVRRAKRASRVRYDLVKGPLFRARAFLMSDATALLAQTHHIIGDATTTSLLMRDLAAAVAAGGRLEQPAAPVGFGDVVLHLDSILADGGAERLLAEWKAEIGGADTELNLPLDRPRPRAQSHRGARLWIAMGPEAALGLRRLAADCGTTVNAAATAALQVVLHRMTGQTDFLIGTGVDERPESLHNQVAGFFVGTLPLRSRIDPEASFRRHAVQALERIAWVRSARHVPFDRLVRELAPNAGSGVPPLVQVYFGMMPRDANGTEAFGAAIDHFNFDHDRARFDLTIILDERADGLCGHLEYATDIMDEASGRLLLARFEAALASAGADPDAPVGDLEILPGPERALIETASQGPAIAYPAEETVPALFARVARARPDHPAIRQGGREVSYRSLDAMSDAVAARLAAAGVTTGDVVAVLADRSPEFVSAVLGVLKAGGAYLGLEPAMPDARLRDLVEAAGARAAIVDAHHRARLGAFAGSVLDPVGAAAPGPEAVAADACGPQSLAYVSFTSGSTGRPKGVCVTHRNILRHVTGLGEAAPGPDDRMLHHTSPAFDLTVFEIWGGLLNGATLVQLPPGPPQIASLAEVVTGEEVSILWLTSGLFAQVVDLTPECLAGRRRVVIGGDVVSPDHMRKALNAAPDSVFFNGYGPTEDTVLSTMARVDAAALEGGDVPIGRPLGNSTAHVLDAGMRPVPVGTEGDLWLGGDGVALGYMNMPEATGAAFLPDPFSEVPGARVYRTGDRARLDHRGVLHFLGRRDQQVKIRGFRVELAEIEALLRRLPGVGDAAVAARRNGAEVTALAAFLVPADSGPAPEVDDLRGALSAKLPGYMVPTEYRWVEALPLNASAKIDRSALLALGDVQRAGGTVAPRTPVEEWLAELWSDVLGRPVAGIDDSFFELGGHSLLAMRLSFRLEEETGLTATAADVFRHPTIRGLAEVIAEALVNAAQPQEVAG